MNAANNTLDRLIVTINVSVDWNPYINMMRPNGVIIFVGAIGDKPMELPIMGPLIIKQLGVVGSVVGGSTAIKEMLQLVADHPEVLPLVETMPFDNINEAIERVVKGDVRFRMVLEH